MSEGFCIKNNEGQEINLAMQELWLGGELLPMGARLVARHVFESAENNPLEVIYSFMLPRDGTLKSFRIEGEGFSVHSDLQPIVQAEETYEQAMADGYLASMTTAHADGVTNLMVGNLQPGKRVTVHLEIMAGVELHDDGYRFRFPFTLAPSYHALAKAVQTAPGEGTIELPEEPFGDLWLPPYRADADNLHGVGFDLSVQTPDGTASVSSPSHPLGVHLAEDQPLRITLSREKDLPNRDLVIDVKTTAKNPVVYTGDHSFAAVIPSTFFGEADRRPSHTVFVIDRSGSMGGDPMSQAKKAVQTCLTALSPEDRFGIIAFDSVNECMSSQLIAGDAAGRKQAEKFLATIDARGGTELQSAVFEAAAMLKRSGGDLFLVTDGQVFETGSIIQKIKALGLRVHTLGIGAASQDRFLTQLARETQGVCRFMSPRERVDAAALELFSSISSPLCSDLQVTTSGETQVMPPPTQSVFANHPVLIFGEGDPATLRLAWQGKKQSLEGEATRSADATTLNALRGSRLIADLELLVGPAPEGRTEQREHERVLKKLESISQEYGLASQAMSLVAVVESERDQSGKLAKTRLVPVGLPEGMAMGAVFGGAVAGGGMLLDVCHMAAPASAARMPKRSLRKMKRSSWSNDYTPNLGEAEGLVMEDLAQAPDPLIDLAAGIEPDGGMPGKNDSERVLRTLIAYACLDGDPRFKRHLERLREFLAAAPEIAELEGTPLAFHERLRTLNETERNAWAMECFGDGADALLGLLESAVA